MNGREARKVACWASSRSATFFVTLSAKRPSANLQSRQNVSQQLLPSPKGQASLSANQYINFPWVCPIIIALLKHCNRILWIPHVVLMAFLCCVVYCHAVLDFTSHLYLLSAFCNSILNAHNSGAIIKEKKETDSMIHCKLTTQNFWLSNVHTRTFPMPSVWYTLRVV